jgi:pimeloyl-ACP methyl ester carboxylesterase
LHNEGAPVDLHELPRSVTAGDALRSLIELHLAKERPTVANVSKATDVSGLPLAELPVEHPSKLMAVVLSGDGGWRDLDKTIAEDLQREGVPVVGLDSLRYFWSRKTPEQTASVVASVIETFMARWSAEKVALIGYSFGADVIPFAYNRLPPSLRDHLVLIALLGLSKSADFEISVGGWLGEAPGADALPVLPEATKIPARLMRAFTGRTKPTRLVLRLSCAASKPSAGTAVITSTVITQRSPNSFWPASSSVPDCPPVRKQPPSNLGRFITPACWGGLKIATEGSNSDPSALSSLRGKAKKRASADE